MNLTKLNAYEMIMQKDLTDLKSEGMLLKHKKSGAKILLVSNDDDNKVFSIAFRTPTKNSTGVPHIIEHSVLCGSDKFPAKDPFPYTWLHSYRKSRNRNRPALSTWAAQVLSPVKGKMAFCISAKDREKSKNI